MAFRVSDLPIDVAGQDAAGPRRDPPGAGRRAGPAAARAAGPGHGRRNLGAVTLTSARAANAARHTIAVICASDGLTHLVTDAAHAAGVAEGAGLYPGLCGHQVAATPLICPPGPPCQRCASHVRGRSPARGRHRARAGAR